MGTMTKHTDTSRSGDLVERLREMGEHPCRSELPMGEDLRQAAAHIEALEAEIKKRGDMVLHMGANTAEMANQYRDRIEALEAEVEWLREALGNLVNAYTANVDTYRLGGFYTDPETEDEVIEARAALGEKQ